jgi:hypothetical protein
MKERLTISALKKLIENLPDDMLVVLEDQNGWYDHVELVEVPEVEYEGGTWYAPGDFQALTFYHGDSSNARDFS